MVPSSSYGKLLAYFLMCVLLCFGLAGLLPLIFLVFGIVMTSYSRQVTHLVTASKLIAGFYGILAGIMGLIAMWHVAALRFACKRPA